MDFSLAACVCTLMACREAEGSKVPDDWPESDDDEQPSPNGEPSDPLGLLTWPLESSKSARTPMALAGLTGAAAVLGLAGGAASGGSSGSGGGTGLLAMGTAGRIDRSQLSSVSAQLPERACLPAQLCAWLGSTRLCVAGVLPAKASNLCGAAHMCCIVQRVKQLVPPAQGG